MFDLQSTMDRCVYYIMQTINSDKETLVELALSWLKVQMERQTTYHNTLLQEKLLQWCFY